jgi:hypothetical protein
MPRSITSTKSDVTRGFKREHQLRLKELVGDAAAKKLAPRLVQTATIYRRSERETNSEAARRSTIGKSHVTAADSALKIMERLPTPIDALTRLLPQASMNGYLPGSLLSTTLGRLTTAAAMKQKLDAVHEAILTLSADVTSWRDAARRDMRRKRGRKIGDRRILNEWVVIQLAGVGVPIRKNPDGTVAKVLEIMYEAIGIKSPVNLYRDVVSAIDNTARERQNLH